MPSRFGSLFLISYRQIDMLLIAKVFAFVLFAIYFVLLSLFSLLPVNTSVAELRSFVRIKFRLFQSRDSINVVKILTSQFHYRGLIVKNCYIIIMYTNISTFYYKLSICKKVQKLSNTQSYDFNELDVAFSIVFNQLPTN